MIAEKVDLATELADLRRLSDESLKLVKGPDFTVDLSEWLTIKRYAQKYGIDTHVVTNWIRRGNIPPECILVVSELNDIRLVKDQPYV